MKKRVLAIFLAVALAIGMLPTAMAEQGSQNGGGAEASSSTVTNGAYGSDGVWAEGGNGTSIVTLEDGTEVQLSKTAQPVAGDPNSFDVTLQVVTTESTITQTGSGAVVLVIDVSGSMDFCATCGGDGEHIKNKNYQCPHYNKKDNDVTDTQTRLYAAKAAALDFLQSYAGTDAGANRQLAIVTFSTWYSTVLDWSNVAGGTDKNSYNQAVSAIKNLKAGGGTNLDAGLYAANKLLANDTVKDISSKSVILLTDGVPTYRRNPRDPDDPDEVLGKGSVGSKENNEAAAKQAAAIKSAGAELYTVCYGVANDETYDDGPTVGNFLRDSIASQNTQDKTYAFNAANADDLNEAFKSITESIASGLDGNGLQVTDPMGDMITGPATSETFPTEDGQTYTWTLTGADTSVDNGVTTYIYTYTYRVTLDVQDPDFKENTFYPTNKPTYLTIDGKEYYFPVPGVKGVLPRTSVTVTKEWVDGNNQDGVRPDEITVQLYKDGTAYGDPVTLDNTNQWSFTWADLIAKSGGKVHTYTVVEALPEGYSAEVTGDASTGFIITNTELTSVTVTKDWKDAAKQDERPTEITVQLVAKVGENPIELANVETECTLTSSDEPGENWTHTWENLPKYDANNQPITYSVVELNVPADYVSTPGTANNNYTITNTLTGKVEVTVTKQWVDGNNQDGVRPDEITVQLYANGNKYGEPVKLNASKTDDDGNWIYTWDEEFEKYDENGEEITYTAQETQVPADYSVSYDGLLITNTHVPAKTSVTVTKEWEDDENRDGLRPGSIEVQLKSNGNPVGDAVTITPDNDSKWTYTWNDLPVNANGNPIVYTVEETEVPTGYTSTPATAENNYTITNTHEIATTSLTVVKEWNDADNQDGIRPTSITVELLADGVKINDAVITADANGNWTHTWNGLPVNDAGDAITYSVVETKVADYDDPSYSEPEVDDTTGAIKITITNSHTPAMIDEIPVEKVWVDGDDQDGIRPESITINLMKTVGETTSLVDTLVLTADNAVEGDSNTWAGSFKNLPVNENGSEIYYFIEELEVEGYTTEIEGFTITNTHSPAAIEKITVTKKWEDKNDQDGLRPKQVVVVLLADGKETSKTLTLNEGNSWTDSFTSLDKYRDGGTEIVYSVQEVQDEKFAADYTATVTGNVADGFTITNTHTPETITIEGSKTWVDNKNQDGKRPTSITINLLANGETVDSKIVTADQDGNWSWSFTVDKYAGGKEINYSITEEAITSADYSTTYDGYNVINTYTPEQTSVTVSKRWNDAGDQDGLRPDEVEVVLLADGKETNKTLTLSEDNNWTSSFTKLAKYRDGGTAIVYTVKEVTVKGYDTEITGNMTDGFTITNTHTPATIDEISVEKVWVDSNNQDGLRSKEVVVVLLADGIETNNTLTLNEGNDWTSSFTKLAKYRDSGTEIVYTVKEVTVKGYDTEITGNMTDGFTITNTHSPAMIDEIPVEKVWVDGDNQDGIRPESITINLMKTVGETTSLVDTLVLTADNAVEGDSNTWAGSFKNLPVNENGSEIYYFIEEIEVEGYTTEIEGFVITNTHSPAAIEKIPVEKIWDDDGNSDGSRPDSVTVNLVKTVNGESSVVGSLTLSDANGWAGAFENLPANEDGKAIVYTITEDEVPGYTTVITGSAAEGFTVTNTHNPATVCISGAKYWLDNFDQDGIRPDSVTIRLYANGKYVGKQVVTRATAWTYSFTNLPKYDNGEPIVYTITEDPVKGYVTTYTVTPFGYDVTNTHVPAVTAIGGTKVWDDAHDQDGKRPDSIVVNLYANGIYVTSQVVSEATDWNWFFGPLAKYYDHGKLVIYTVTENAVDGYTTVIKGNKIINSYTPEETSVTVMKVWDDADNQDGIRANDVTVKLLADGKDTGLTAVLSAGNDWTATFTGLDKYRDGGIEIVYTVEEAEVPAGYEVSYSIDADGIKVTNTHTPETVTIEGSKTWDDNDNQDGMRPEYITIRLYADGVEVDSKLVTEGDGWSWSFEDMPKYKAGVEIVYSITEDVVENYTADVDGFDVTNTHTPGKTFVNVIKTWNDKDNQDGIRPDSVKVHLYANGEPTDLYLTLNAENGWTGVFSDLDEYQNGVAVQYTIKEIAVEGYDTAITGDAVTGYTISNTHVPETVDVSGSKTWDDADNQDGKRPDSITVNLLANGVEIDEAVVTAEDGWTYSFEDLPKFEDGAEITYTITEDLVEGYTVAVNGYDLVNSYTPGKTTVTVTKAWSDSNDKDGLRPDSVTIRLLANGADTGKTLVLTAEGKWTGIFTDLDEYAGGEKIVYTVTEDVVKGYNAVISGDAATGFIVTNSHTTTPKTGDSAMPFLMGGIGAAALVLFLGLLLAKRKKEEY